MVSVIIPNRNKAAALGQALRAVFASEGARYEVIVVDDASSDCSAEVARRYPVRLLALREQVGAARARNLGASMARGQVLLFTDSDCLLRPHTLRQALRCLRAQPPGTILGGTYTLRSPLGGFFDRFQSAFVHYCETRRQPPDYVASHLMVLEARVFRACGGFPEGLPMLEDVALSHRAREMGFRLVLEPALQVGHLFGFSLWGSLRNAFRKAYHWGIYALRRGQLLRDSGTASLGLKASGFSAVLAVLLLGLWALTAREAVLLALPLIGGLSGYVNRGLFRVFFRAGGWGFMLLGMLYYLGPFALAAMAGGLAGAMRYGFRPWPVPEPREAEP
jgi:glycosyltransferase involved in cell wall biosynthesis